MSAGPPVVAGVLAEDSLAPSIVALVRAGVDRDPVLAAEIRARVVLRLTAADGAPAYPPVVIDFGGARIEVRDLLGDESADADLEVSGRLPDVLVLVSAPLTAGVPRPTSARGRAAIARVADGRIEFDGPVRLARKVTRLLRIPL